MKVIDQLDREINFSTKLNRIVSLVPSQTELLYDLGLEAEIVGITKFCVHPYHLKSTKTVVGGTKNINLQKIKALKPDIILCNKEENTKEIVEQCETITLVHVSDVVTIDDTFDLINQYSKLFFCEEKAIEIIDKIDFCLQDFESFISAIAPKKVAYFIWRKPWMVAANNTFINYLLALNKFDNIYVDKNKYPEITIENIKLERELDLILLSSEPFPFKEAHILELDKHTLECSKTILVDGEMFSWYGSRLIKAFSYFKESHQRII